MAIELLQGKRNCRVVIKIFLKRPTLQDRRNVRGRSAQCVLYYDFVKVEFQRLLTRSKNRAQAISQPGDDYDRLRYKNWMSLINDESGAWLSAGSSSKMFEMSNTEFISAVCRRNTVDDATIPKYTPSISRENPQLFHCACDGRTRPKVIDPFGYHLTGRKIGANAMRVHDEVVRMFAKLFRALHVDAGPLTSVASFDLCAAITPSCRSSSNLLSLAIVVNARRQFKRL